MIQHHVDLLPDEVRAKSQARVVASRNFGIAALAIGATILVVTQSRLQVSAAEHHLSGIKAQATELEDNERQRAAIRTELNHLNAQINKYHRVENPLPVSTILATVVRLLPDSVTLDRMDIHAGVQRQGRARRSATTDNGDELRLLFCEISGFAATDDHIAALVGSLRNTAPFERISLDFTRQRVVRESNAREFRISFRIPLEHHYIVEDIDTRNVAQHD